MAPRAAREDAEDVSGDDGFIAWVESALYDAELALHNGDPAPRRALGPVKSP